MAARPITLAFLTLLCALTANAEIYKTVDENGKVTYTDNPEGKKAEAVNLPKTNTQLPVKPRTATPSGPGPEHKSALKAQSPSYRLAIQSPKDGTLVTQGQQTLRVGVNITPALVEGHFVRATLNGEAFGHAFEGTDLVLEALYRGTHKLAVQVLADSGKVLAQSPPITIHVQRISLNSPKRRAP